MTEDEQLKWLSEPASRQEVADLMAQLGVMASSLANTCADILAQDTGSATQSLREVISDGRLFSKMLRKFSGSSVDE